MKIYYSVFFILVFLIPNDKQIGNYIYSKDSEIKRLIDVSSIIQKKITTGAEQFDKYEHFLKNKNVAVVTNQTGRVNNLHLVDFLLSKNVNLIKVFAPEHGFRGDLDRGKEFDDNIDKVTGLPIVAMYGKNKKPTPEQFSDIDIVLFDIQDVGVRFFTYLSSMHYVMEACAENNKQLIILDRPNPLGDYVDGPVLEKEFQSFIGMHSIPIVHGCTLGELALMINGEKWLANGIECDLHIIKILNYDHSINYSLPIKPSPNLPNDISIRLYPSLCFFEASEVSIGRGTDFPFQVIGYPNKAFGEFSFIPKDMPGMQIDPIQEGKECYGVDLRKNSLDSKFTLMYLISFSKLFENKADMITRKSWFNLLSGNSSLAKQIISGMQEDEIKATWQNDIKNYKILRKKYLLYTDFE